MRISFCADFGSSCQTAAFLSIVQATHHMLLNLYFTTGLSVCASDKFPNLFAASSLVYFSNFTAQHLRYNGEKTNVGNMMVKK